jgi:hypothetical protein
MALYLFTSQEFPRFHSWKYVFRYQTPQSTDLDFNLIEDLLLEACVKVKNEGRSVDEVVHFYLECEGMHHQFHWAATGPMRLTLGEFLYSTEARSEVINKWARIIQSNKDIKINHSSYLTVQTFDVPFEYTIPRRYDYVN